MCLGWFPRSSLYPRIPLRNVFVLRSPFQELQQSNLSFHAKMIPGLIELVPQFVANLLTALHCNARPVDGFVEFRQFREFGCTETDQFQL